MLVVIAVALGAAPSALAASTGQISGTVTRASGGAAIQEIEVCAFSTSAEEFSAESFGCATTSSSGEYTITALASGQYDVEFISPSESEPGYITQYYDDTTSYEGAKAVPVASPGTTSGIDAELEEGGRIAGEVTRPGGAAIEGITVCASAVHGEGFGCAKTKSNGTYTITGMAGGNYDVEFFPSFESGLDFIAQYYNDRSSSKEAEAVPVTAPMTTSNIDAKLEEGARVGGGRHGRSRPLRLEVRRNGDRVARDAGSLGGLLARVPDHLSVNRRITGMPAVAWKQPCAWPAL